jgi:hypothetical protein
MSVDFAPDGRLVTSGRDFFARTWDGAGTKLNDLPPLGDIALHAVFASEGAVVVAAAFNGQVVASSSTDSKPLATTTTSPRPSLSGSWKRAPKCPPRRRRRLKQPPNFPPPKLPREQPPPSSKPRSPASR